ncbi:MULTISPECIES: rod shape-determining protein MreD [Shewanella]|uniref:Rod shape-determining protein MreD n=1 Tax=Shewanella salipaludis TaxID=2723052 RepID=A0A972JJK0_9GAMM|nr:MULTISPECIES: rod shape-determining protein MreD [Shewanella]MCE9685907.1 rod shape-determining protein MreD [Shewanella sp. AS16]NMH65225.1 rod shape-determining protein MreD [Shewanella salipaludis]
MNIQAANGRMAVWVTLFLGILFQIMPLPEVVESWRPDWLLMVIIYWAVALPHRYNILTAWVLGVALDILLGANLGIRALALSLVVYVVVLHFQRIRHFPRWQQTLLVMCLVLLYHLVIFWLEFVISGAKFEPDFLLPAVSSLVIWPWLFLILRRVRRLYKVR